MRTETVSVARIYVRESEGLLDKIVRFLHDDSGIAGVTVLRGIEGFSEGGATHPAFLLDLALDLPLVIEFFDEPERVDAVLHSLVRRFPLSHIVSWPARRHIAKNSH